MLVNHVEMVINTKMLLTIFAIVLELIYGNKGRRGVGVYYKTNARDRLEIMTNLP